MFEEETEVYLMDAYPEIDGSKRSVKLRCYLNPVSYEQCAEVDEEIARTLFHLVGRERLPRPLLHKASFVTNLPPYSLTYCRDPRHSNSRVHIPTAFVTKVEAAKVTPESNDFALMFTVGFEKNDPKVLNDLADLLHEKFFMGFTELQRNLFEGQDPVMEMVCRLCEAALPAFGTTDGKFAYCAACAINKQEEEVLRRIRDAVKAADVISEMREPGDEEFREGERPDPLAEEGAFINKRNRPRRRSAQ